MTLIKELKRRNVFRMAILYVISAWLILQIGDVLFELLGVPDWTLKFVFGLLILGFPFALFFSWAYELTPEGLKKESEIDPSQSITPRTGKRLDRIIIVVLAAAVVLLLIDRWWTPEAVKGSGSITYDEAVIEPDPFTANPKSIAVLPFDDFTAAGEDDWFADGLTEEILNVLTRAPDLLVASRTSSFRFRDSELPVPEIASVLGVAHVLEGSVRRSPDRIRVTAQLIRADDGFHLWSETYDREPSEVIEIQEDIAVSIAQALETAMDPEALKEMLQAGTRSVEAYNAYLKGVALIGSAEASGSYDASDALEAFNRARGLDPEFAEAAYQAAVLYRDMSISTNMLRSSKLTAAELREGFETAIQAAIQATNDVTRPKYEALQASARLRFRRAQEKLDAYLAARPNDRLAWYDYGLASRKIQDVEAVRRSVNERLRIAPTDLLQLAALDLLQVGLIDEALPLYRRALELHPDNAGVQYQAHRGFLWAELTGEAEELERSLLAGDLAERYKNNVRIRGACARGDRDAAEKLLPGFAADDLFGRWYALKLFGRNAAADAVLAPLDHTDAGRDDLAGYLIYRHFDPGPYPNLTAALRRDNIDRPPPVDIPFACPPPETPSIAVLPFDDLSPEGDQEYFADGISEELLNQLVRLPNLKVAGRTSSFAFKGRNEDLRRIGDLLGVTHILEGSVRKAGNRLRITAQLVKSSDGFHLWSETYERELDDVFAIQDEISAAIVEALKLTIGGDETPAPTARTANMEAYERYLEGRTLISQRGSALPRAIEQLDTATRLDPGYAPAWAALAQAHALTPYYSYTTRLQQALAAAEIAARRALELDPELAAAHSALADVLRDRYQWLEAEASYLRALELNPSEIEANSQYGQLLGSVGHFERALPYMARAAELDPLAALHQGLYGYFLFQAGETDQGIARLKRATELNPELLFLKELLMGAMINESRLAEALELQAEISSAVADLPSEWVVAQLHSRLASGGDPAATVALLRKGLDQGWDHQLVRVAWSVHLGEPALALDVLRSARGADQLIDLTSLFTPFLAPMRQLPGFAKLMKEVGAVDYWRERGWPEDCAPIEGGDDFECGRS